MSHLRQVFLVLGFGVIAGPIAYGLFADVKAVRAQAFLAEIAAAERDLSFTSIRTMTTADGPSPVTVVHRVYGTAPMRRRMEFIGVEGAKPTRPAKPAFNPFMFLQHIQSALAGPGLSRPGGLASRFGAPELIARNYSISRVGSEPVAGRAADIYEIAPRHAGRAGYRIWADHENRFPLRYQIRKGTDVVFESSTRSITYEQPAVSFAPRSTRRSGDLVDITTESVTAEDLPVHLKFKSFLPTELPDGFVQQGSLKTSRAKVRGMEEAFWAVSATYTDGIATMMLLEFDANNRLWKQVQVWLAGLGEAPVVAEKGKVVAQRMSSRGGCAIRLTIEGTEIIASGQVSPEDLERMVRSLKRMDGRSE